MAFEVLQTFETSNVPLLIFLLFTSGVVEEILETWVTFTIMKRQTIRTGFITFFGDLLDCMVFAVFVSNLDKWPVIVAYSIGATVGTVSVIEWQKYETRKKKALQKQRRVKGIKRKKEAQRLVALRKAEKLKKIAEARKIELKKIEKVVEKKVKKDESTQSTTKITPINPSDKPSS